MRIDGLMKVTSEMCTFPGDFHPLHSLRKWIEEPPAVHKDARILQSFSSAYTGNYNIVISVAICKLETLLEYESSHFTFHLLTFRMSSCKSFLLITEKTYMLFSLGAPHKLMKPNAYLY